MKVELPGSDSLPPPTFKNFVTEMASTALVCLGYIQSPVHGKKTLDLKRADHIIGLLNIIHQKTIGNLDEGEQDYLEAALDDLRDKLVVVRSQQGPTPNGEHGSNS